MTGGKQDALLSRRGRPRQKHVALRLRDEIETDAAEQRVLQPRHLFGAGHDQIGANLGGILADTHPRRAVTNHSRRIAPLRRVRKCGELAVRLLRGALSISSQRRLRDCSR